MLIDYQNLTDSLVRDDAGKLTAADRDVAILLAVIRYSQDRPRELVDDVVTTDSHFAPMPTDWRSGFSTLYAIESPPGEVPPVYLDKESYSVYLDGNGDRIMLNASMTVGSTLRISYTAPHVLDDTVDTLPLKHREAVCCWAAAHLCDQLSSFYSGDTDSTIMSDSVEHQSKASEFARRAKTFRARYHDELGIDPKRNVAHGVVVSFDRPNSLGQDHLTH